MLKFLQNILKKGIRVGWSSGKPFDPTDQVRTDGMDDIIKKEEERNKK